MSVNKQAMRAQICECLNVRTFYSVRPPLSIPCVSNSRLPKASGNLQTNERLKRETDPFLNLRKIANSDVILSRAKTVDWSAPELHVLLLNKNLAFKNVLWSPSQFIGFVRVHHHPAHQSSCQPFHDPKTKIFGFDENEFISFF